MSRKILTRPYCGIVLSLLGFQTGLSGAVGGNGGMISLVENGKARAVLVVDTEADESAREAARLMQSCVKRATGVELPLLDSAALATVPPEILRVFMGGGNGAAELGAQTKDLAEDEYLISASTKGVVIAGAPSRRAKSPPVVAWAVADLLDRHLGVRWLWPGEIGTYVPASEGFQIPSGETRYRPELMVRTLRTHLKLKTLNGRPVLMSNEEHDRLKKEGLAWLQNFQMGSRLKIKLGHAFMEWWKKYSVSHPDYFAIPPQGQSQPYPQPDRVKLNLGNPAVTEQILADWRKSGRPDDWNVCPNDGVGFCTGAASRAMDVPPDQNPEDIWLGRGQLTARYVKFWNGLLEVMRSENPNVHLYSLAYGCYREPPPEGLKVHDGLVLRFVNSWGATEEWRKWNAAGADLLLRPNWWHMSKNAPYMQLRDAGEFFRFARTHGMAGFDFDTMHGYWGTQAPMYYLIARLSVRPDLSVDEVLGEFCSAFGPASTAIREYLNYWDDFSRKAAYPIPAGGPVSQGEDSLYAQTRAKHPEIHENPVIGGWEVMPYIYTDEVLAPAQQILDRAETLVAKAPEDVRQRVLFLKDGLEEFRLTRNVIARNTDASLFPAQEKYRTELAKAADELHAFRAKVAPRHVIWADAVLDYEKYRNAPIPEPGSKDARSVGKEELGI